MQVVGCRRRNRSPQTSRSPIRRHRTLASCRSRSVIFSVQLDEWRPNSECGATPREGRAASTEPARTGRSFFSTMARLFGQQSAKTTAPDARRELLLTDDQIVATFRWRGAAVQTQVLVVALPPWLRLPRAAAILPDSGDGCRGSAGGAHRSHQAAIATPGGYHQAARYCVLSALAVFQGIIARCAVQIGHSNALLNSRDCRIEETEDAGVFEIAVHNADDGDIFAPPLHAGAKAADAANIQPYFDAFL